LRSLKRNAVSVKGKIGVGKPVEQICGLAVFRNPNPKIKKTEEANRFFGCLMVLHFFSEVIYLVPTCSYYTKNRILCQ
jgi:hypothetical protein